MTEDGEFYSSSGQTINFKFGTELEFVSGQIKSEHTRTEAVLAH